MVRWVTLWRFTGAMRDDGQVTRPDEPKTITEPTHATVSEARRSTRYIGAFALVMLIVAALDQVIKVISVNFLEGQPAVNVIGEWLQLRLLRNPGAAFSMGEGSTWLFTTLQLTFVVLSVGAAVTGRLTSRWLTVAVGLIAGGALGNLLDRFFREPGFWFGHVVDMFSVRGFAVFNFADAAITIGVILMAGWIIFSPEARDEKSDTTKEATDA